MVTLNVYFLKRGPFVNCCDDCIDHHSRKDTNRPPDSSAQSLMQVTIDIYMICDFSSMMYQDTLEHLLSVLVELSQQNSLIKFTDLNCIMSLVDKSFPFHLKSLAS